MKIACFGDNCIDFYKQTGERFPGGNPVNVAVNIRRLGGSASYIGAVGNDGNGSLILDSLRKRDIDVSRVRTEEGKTAVSLVNIENGNRVFGDYDEGVTAGFRPSEDDIDFICSHDIAFTALWGHSEGSLEEIRKRGTAVAFDASEDPFGETAMTAVPYTNVFFFSDDQGDDHEVAEKLRNLIKLGPDIAVAMRGSRGSMAYDGVELVMHGIVPCDPVDTMGAGDSYIAGFLTAWLSGKPVRDCMSAGAESAAETIMVSGAWI